MAQGHWSLYSFFIILPALAWGFWWYERRKSSMQEVALVATLAALAGLSRVPFAAIPAVQPTTFLVLISGYVFGPAPGFMVGTLAALVSNFFLGHGPWTPWQMAAWGLAGIVGGLAGRKGRAFPRISMSILAFSWGFIFGWFLNLWHWLAFVYPLSMRSFLIVQASGFWSDLMHALGNAAFMYLAGETMINIFARFKRRMSVTYLAAGEMGEMEEGKTAAEHNN